MRVENTAICRGTTLVSIVTHLCALVGHTAGPKIKTTFPESSKTRQTSPKNYK